MASVFVCPKCGSVLSTGAAEGTETICPDCGGAVTVAFLGGHGHDAETASSPDSGGAAAVGESAGKAAPANARPAGMTAERAALDRNFYGWLISLILLTPSFFIAFVTMIVVLSGFPTHFSSAALAVFVLFLALFVGCLIWHVVMWGMLLYRFWQLIPPERAATTPEDAVRFMFIPLFNLYWQFIAWGKLGKEFDREGVSRGLAALALIYCTVCLLYVLSGLILGWWTGFVVLILYIMIVVSFREAAVRLLERRSAAVELVK